MNNKLDALIGEYKRLEMPGELNTLEARVWQKIDVNRPRGTALYALNAVRALPVIAVLVIGGAVGANARVSQQQFAAFSPDPAYAVSRLMQ